MSENHAIIPADYGDFTVTILGNNSALPAYGRLPTSQLVTVQGAELLIDCGEGSLIQMQRYGLRWGRINHIFISHLHGDHYFGIFGLITSMNLLGRDQPLDLYAPAQLEGILQSILDAANSSLNFELRFHPLPADGGLLLDAKGFSVSTFPTIHRIACNGFVITEKTKGRKLLPEKCREHQIPTYFFDRLKNGEDYETKSGEVIKNDWVTEAGPHPRKYAYCADTLYTETLIPHIAGADLIYHESTFLEAQAERALARFHSTAKEAATIALKGGCGQLLLGHYSSRYKELKEFEEEAKAVFDASIATEEGKTYSIPRK